MAAIAGYTGPGAAFGITAAAVSLLATNPGNPDAAGPPAGNTPAAASLLADTKFGPIVSEWLMDAKTDGGTTLTKFWFWETADMNGFKTVFGIANNNCWSHDNFVSNMFMRYGGIVHNMLGLAVKYVIRAAIFMPKIADTTFKPMPLPN